MTYSPLLKASQLSHKYGSYQVLDEMDLELNAGEIAFLEGANGSGKSTLLLCLSGLMRPTKGVVEVNGFNISADDPEAKRCLAFVPDVPRFYMELTAWEHLRFIAAAHGAEKGFEARAEALLKEFGLWQSKDLFPYHYSRGMSLKLGLLLALIRPFKVLLMDEPLSALDADSRVLLVDRLKVFRSQGAAVLLSSHDPFLKEGLADKVYSLNDGCLTLT